MAIEAHGDTIPSARILVVDDDPLARKHLDTVLTHAGHQVLTVESGEAALDRLAAGECFDVALVDLKMRGIGGMDVVKALREQWPETVTIVLTAYASLETVFEALRLGAYDYLFKPCHAAELLDSVHKGLLMRQQPPPADLVG